MTQFSLNYQANKPHPMSRGTLGSSSFQSTKQSLVVASLPLATAILAIAVNYYGESGQIMGTTNKAISALNDTAITPAGKAFIIWSLLYVGSIATGVYLLINRDAHLARATRAFVLVNLANASFPLLFHTGNMPLSVISTATLTLALILAYATIRANQPAPTMAQRWFLKFPTQLYLGWAAAATAVNITQALQQLGWRAEGSQLDLLSSGVLVVLVGLGLVLVFKLRDTVTPLSIGWALYWIGEAQSDMPTTPKVAFAGLAILILAAAVTATQQWARGRRELA